MILYIYVTSGLFLCLKLLNQSHFKVKFQLLDVKEIVPVQDFKEHVGNLLCFLSKS